MPRTRNRKVKRQKHMSGKRMALVILYCSFVTFLVVAILVAIFKPDLLGRIAEYSADFIKVILGAVLFWLFHRSRGP